MKIRSVIVTISREYGAAALDIAAELGALLGYRVFGEDLPAIAAVRLGASRDDVAAVESRPPSLAERFIANLGTASPETQATTAAGVDEFETDVRKEIEAAVREAAAGGDAIIVGRIANMILRGRDDLLRVFLHAPIAYRTVRVQTSLGISADEARKEIARIDDARRRWAKAHYGLDWGTARHYDLTIDVSRFDVSGSAALIATAARETRR